jgi:hypothetical protein
MSPRRVTGDLRNQSDQMRRFYGMGGRLDERSISINTPGDAVGGVLQGHRPASLSWLRTDHDAERCPDCGQTVPDPAREGWICPRCGTSNAPWSASCANPDCREIGGKK